jgi:hypothetical protein
VDIVGGLILPVYRAALGPEDQDQHQEQEGQYGRHLRNRELEQRVAEGLGRHGVAEFGQQRHQRLVHRDREGLDQAYQQRGQEGAAERAHAAHDHHDKDDGADRAGHGGLGDEGVAAYDAGQARQRRAAAEDQHEDARHVVAQGLHRFRMRQRGLDHQPYARAREQQPDAGQHGQRDEHDEGARLGEVGAEHGEERALQAFGQHVIDGRAAPHQLHQLQQQVGQPEGDQQFGHVAELVHLAQAKALEGRADHKHQQRRHQQRPPEAYDLRGAVGDVGPNHVEGRVREIEHAHHAEDQRQARAQHEQQQAVAEAVEQGDGEKFQIHQYRLKLEKDKRTRGREDGRSGQP